MSGQQTHAERELAALIVESLNLEGISADQIEPDKPLFGDEYGLDSIDALELSLAINQRYGVQLKSDDEHSREVFSSLRHLSAYIDAHRGV